MGGAHSRHELICSPLDRRDPSWTTHRLAETLITKLQPGPKRSGTSASGQHKIVEMPLATVVVIGGVEFAAGCNAVTADLFWGPYSPLERNIHVRRFGNLDFKIPVAAKTRLRSVWLLDLLACVEPSTAFSKIIPISPITPVIMITVSHRRSADKYFV